MACPRSILPILAALAILVGGCATGTVYLQMNQLPTDQTLDGSLGAEPFNAVRFVTVGPTTSQNIGYFLFRDRTEVTMTPGVPLERLDGKMSMRETVADYFGQSKSRDNKRISPPLIREVLKGEDIVGYSVADMNMGVSVWDRPGEGDVARGAARGLFRGARPAGRPDGLHGPPAHRPAGAPGSGAQPPRPAVVSRIRLLASRVIRTRPADSAPAGLRTPQSETFIAAFRLLRPHCR